jgi:hypothetical protein
MGGHDRHHDMRGQGRKGGGCPERLRDEMLHGRLRAGVRLARGSDATRDAPESLVGGEHGAPHAPVLTQGAQPKHPREFVIFLVYDV